MQQASEKGIGKKEDDSLVKAWARFVAGAQQITSNRLSEFLACFSHEGWGKEVGGRVGESLDGCARC